jgi:hypothetical protein
MNAYEVVLKPAKLPLILFALSVLIAVAVVFGLAKFRSEKELSIQQSMQQLSTARDNIKTLTFDVDTINKLAEKYQRLGQLGFIGEPDRDGWVQRLESLYRDTHLPPTLRYTLAPPQLLNPQAVRNDAPLAHQNTVSHHDLALELSGIHEVELIDFINKLRTDWQAPYRFEACQMTRDAEVLTGLQIKCTVQLYSLPLKQ